MLMMKATAQLGVQLHGRHPHAASVRSEIRADEKLTRAEHRVGSAEAKRARRRERNLKNLFSQRIGNFFEGRMSINDVRADDGLPLVEGGDTIYCR